jgi:hypothetical protein
MGSMRFNRSRRERPEDNVGLGGEPGRPLAARSGTAPALRHMGWISAEGYAEACANPAVRELISSALAVSVPPVEGSDTGTG